MSAFRERVAQGSPLFGGWLFEGSVSALRGYHGAGFDYIGIDCQHSTLDEAGATALIGTARDLGWLAVARVSENATAPIGRLLDAGAHAVIVPGVDTAEEAAAAVAACRYPPHGHRSFGPLRGDLGSTPEDIAAGAECIVMIETAEGMRNLEAIVATKGLGGVYIGPADLSIGLGRGVARGFAPGGLAAEISLIAGHAHAHGLLVGAHAGGANGARESADLGCDFISIGGNTSLFNQAAAALATDLRNPANPTTHSNMTAESPYAAASKGTP